MGRKDDVLKYVSQHEGKKFAEIAEAIQPYNYYATATALKRLIQEGKLVQKGIKGAYEYYPVCTNRVAMAREAAKAEMRPLSSYEPRELLAELKARGYVWEKMYVKQYVEYSKI